MPIHKFLAGQAFDPEAITSMSQALIGACETLGLKIVDDNVTRMVAARIIDAAREGERDSEKLKAAAIKGLRH